MRRGPGRDLAQFALLLALKLLGEGGIPSIDRDGVEPADRETCSLSVARRNASALRIV